MTKLSTVTTDLLKERLESQNLILLEALPKKYFDQGHLPKAINVPLDISDEDVYRMLPDRSSVLITYCTGLTCPNSKKLAERLLNLGYNNVLAYEEGKEGWVRSGSKLERI